MRSGKLYEHVCLLTNLHKVFLQTPLNPLPLALVLTPIQPLPSFFLLYLLAVIVLALVAVASASTILQIAQSLPQFSTLVAVASQGEIRMPDEGSGATWMEEQAKLNCSHCFCYISLLGIGVSTY